MSIFGREPALILGALSATLSLAVAFGVPGITDATATLIVALITAIFGAITAAITRPIAPAAFTAVVTAAAALLAGYGFDVSAEMVAAVNGAVLAALTLITREQVTPTTKGSIG